MIHRSKYHNYSGGAEGSDQYWDIIGKRYGFNNHTHYHFEYRDIFDKYYLTLLAQKDLNKADEYLKKANLTLKRKFPTSSNYIDNLLRRNYYQVINSEGIFAIGVLNKDKQTVKGGTGWAVELGKLFNKKIYVFDQELDQWFTWDYKNQFFTISEVPLLTYTYAGIGTRELKENGKINIGLVYRKTLKHLWENYEKER